MIPVYAQQPFPEYVERTLFLAGPTPRSADVQSWRPEALEWLKANAQGMHVFVPESGDQAWRKDYDTQVEWESAALARADAIVFWVPRKIETMPAFTTNVEFGLHIAAKRVFYGRPSHAEKIGFLDYHAKALGLPVFTTLTQVLSAATKVVRASPRYGADTKIPRHVWAHTGFAAWLKEQKRARNVILTFAVPYVGPSSSFIIRARLWIERRKVLRSIEMYFGHGDHPQGLMLHGGL